MLVERFDPNGPVARHRPGEPGDAQAPFVEADLLAAGGRVQHGIDQDGEGQLVPFPGRPLLGRQLPPALRAVVQDRELDRHADLGRGQPDPGRGGHGGPHLGDEQLELAAAQVGRVNQVSRAAQDGITALDDGQYARAAHGR